MKKLTRVKQRKMMENDDTVIIVSAGEVIDHQWTYAKTLCIIWLFTTFILSTHQSISSKCGSDIYMWESCRECRKSLLTKTSNYAYYVNLSEILEFQRPHEMKRERDVLNDALDVSLFWLQKKLPMVAWHSTNHEKESLNAKDDERLSHSQLE